MFNKPTSAWFYCTFSLKKMKIEKILFVLLHPRQSRKAQKVQSLSQAVSQKTFANFITILTRYGNSCARILEINQPAEV